MKAILSGILYLSLLIASLCGCKDQKKVRSILLGAGLICFIGAAVIVMALPPVGLVMFPLGVLMLGAQTILVERIQKVEPTYS